MKSRFFSVIYKTLEFRNQELKEELIKKKDFITQTVLKLHGTEQEIENLILNKDGFNAFADGLKRVYKRGRKAKKKVQKEPSVENYHEWRKRVKYLWYQLRLLKNAWPEGLEGYIKQLHELSNLLGDDHDLHEFKNQLHHISFIAKNTAPG